MGSSYYQDLSADMKLRYDEKIRKCGGVDPYAINEKDLSQNRKDFPGITLKFIENHFIHSPSPFTKNQVKAHKSMEGYRFFQSGFVLNVGSKKLNNSAILKGKVKHSQRMNASPLQVWILAKMDGKIICAHCTCIAGLSETCSHAAAVCFAVNNITESSTATSVTQMLCQWNVPKFNEVSMSSVQDTKWTVANYETSGTSTQDPESWFRTYCDSLTNFSDDIIVNFINTVNSDCPEPALRTIMYPEERRRASKINDEVFLANLYSINNIEKTRSELVEIGTSKPLIISINDIEEIARLTVQPHKSKFWIALRRGRITGSNIKDCCVTSIENPSISTINQVINITKNLDRIPSVKYQRKNKKKAIDRYVREAEIHENFEYKQCGLVINRETPYFAASSDGLVSCNCCGNGCVEVKCFKILESDESFDVFTQRPNKFLYKIGEDFFLEETHEFFYKAQMQIHLYESEYYDFVLWSPKRNLVVRVNANTGFWNVAKEKALSFHREVVMPELLGKYYTRSNDLPLTMEECDEEYLNLDLIGLEIELINTEDEQ